MRAHFGLPSVECEDSEGKPPIQVKFEIPYFTTSGIQVRFCVTFLDFIKIHLSNAFILVTGSLSEDHRKERLPGITVGTLHNPERRLPVENKLSKSRANISYPKSHNLRIHKHLTIFHSGCPPGKIARFITKDKLVDVEFYFSKSISAKI